MCRRAAKAAPEAARTQDDLNPRECESGRGFKHAPAVAKLPSAAEIFHPRGTVNKAPSTLLIPEGIIQLGPHTYFILHYYFLIL